MEEPMRTILLGIAVTIVASACSGGGGPAPVAPAGSPAATAAPAVAGAKTHEIRGRIEAIAAGRNTVTLDHESIPGVMDAMKMEYQVQEPAVLDGLSVGDRVQGQLEVRAGDQYVITQLRK